MNYQWLFDTPIAHRGTHDDKFPENSLPAYAESIKNGLNIEIDVHTTKDGKLVVFHDDDLKRVCGVDKKIKDSTLEEIKLCRICGTEYQIPTLDEFLELVDGKTGILLEVKGINPFDLSIVKPVVERVKKYNGPIALQSFNFGSVGYMRRHCSLPVGELCTWSAPGGKKFRSWICNFMGKAWVCKFTRPDFIAYDVNACDPKFSHNKWIEKWGKKLPILFWTVTTEEKIDTASKFANNVIFEYLSPEYAKERHKDLMEFKCRENKIPSNLQK
ncbi:MAG: hypothetical protein MJ068_02745 [Clostridia bacterium]|nr:hypothetical protein [Clostridia bacterium]